LQQSQNNHCHWCNKRSQNICQNTYGVKDWTQENQQAGNSAE